MKTSSGTCKSFCYFVCNWNSATRQREHDHIIAVRISAQSLGQLPSSICTIAECSFHAELPSPYPVPVGEEVRLTDYFTKNTRTFLRSVIELSHFSLREKARMRALR